MPAARIRSAPSWDTFLPCIILRTRLVSHRSNGFVDPAVVTKTLTSRKPTLPVRRCFTLDIYLARSSKVRMAARAIAYQQHRRYRARMQPTSCKAHAGMMRVVTSTG